MVMRLIVCSIIFVSTSAQADHQKPTLCNSSEKIVFSCAVSKKIVSLCATPDMTANTGRLTYRFGVFGSAMDLEFSNNKLGPASSYTVLFETWKNGTFGAISFERGEYSYTVYTRMAAQEEGDPRSNGAGVQVHHNKKQVADLWCKDASISDNIWEALHELGLPTTSAY
jgi:hypothetical protein